MKADIPNAEAVLEGIIRLAERFPDQPVCVIKNERSGELKAGVLSLCQPAGDDWFYEPVALDSSFPQRVDEVLK